VKPWTAGTHEYHDKRAHLPDEILPSLDAIEQEHESPSPDEHSPEDPVLPDFLRIMFAESNLIYVSDTTGDRLEESRGQVHYLFLWACESMGRGG
jgi:hypothetical protein